MLGVLKRLLSAVGGGTDEPRDVPEDPAPESDRRLEEARQRLKETIPPRDD